MSKRLYRSEKNKIIAGVIGGIGEYLDVDPVLLRVIWVAITVLTGVVPGVIVYTVLILLVPKMPEEKMT